MTPIYDSIAIRQARQARALCDILAGVQEILRFFSNAAGPAGGELDLLLTANPDGEIQDLGGGDVRAPMTCAQLQALIASANGFLADAEANAGALTQLYALFANSPRTFSFD